MSLHKLTAGSGYDYLTRQVAVFDATELGHRGLTSYYTERGEAPGMWLGSGLAGLGGLRPGDPVTAEQMEALFGAGLHPLAVARRAALAGPDLTDADYQAVERLGAPFKVYTPDVSPFRVEVARRFAAWNRHAGVPADWPVPAEVRAQIRSEVGAGFFRAEQGRDPADARELAGTIARLSRPRTTAVAGYDLTFSPVKSVSALWAVADPPVAAAIERAHQAAVGDALRFIETHALFSRVGANGVRQVDVHGLVAAAFTHRDSRAGDPDLHTHVAVANKVQTLDGRWLSIDGRILFKANVTASETYNTALEQHLTATLGVRFVDRPGVRGKRPVREIVGVDPRLNAALVVAQAGDRRPPRRTRRRLPRRAWAAGDGGGDDQTGAAGEPGNPATQTRPPHPHRTTRPRGPPKPPTCSAAGTPSPAWCTPPCTRHPRTCRGRMGGGARRRSTASSPPSKPAGRAGRAGMSAPKRNATPATSTSSRVRRRRWSATSSTRSSTAPSPSPPTTGSSNRPCCGAGTGPACTPIAGATHYTSTAVLEAEERLVDLAGRTDGRHVGPRWVDAVVADAAGRGRPLNPGQVALVTEMAGSGRRVQLAIAPAGSGKTTAMAALAAVWTRSGGTVVGLAPSAAAAEQLAGPGPAPTPTPWRNSPGRSTTTTCPTGPAVSARAAWSSSTRPGWPTPCPSHRVCDFVVGRGGSVRLVGDDQQLAAIGAGGVLRDIAHTHGAVRLDRTGPVHPPRRRVRLPRPA